MVEPITLKTFAELQPGEHICWRNNENHNGVELQAAYTAEGLRLNQKVAVVFDFFAYDRFISQLIDLGIDVQQTILREQLVLIDAQIALVINHRFEPGSFINFIRHEYELARAAGFPALRVFIAMDRSTVALADQGQLIDFENAVNALLVEYPVLVACQYEPDWFDQKLVLDVFQSHPYILTGNEVHENVYYLPAANCEGAEPQSALDRWIYRLVDKNHADQMIYERERKFRQLYEDAPQAYQSLDVKGCIIDVNPAWCNQLGYEREEVIGQWFGRFLVPEQQEVFRNRFGQFKACGIVRDAEFEMVRKDGAHLIVSANGQIGYDTQGNFRQTHCILTDITLKKKAEKDLREGEQFYKVLYEYNPEIILLIEPESGAIVHANPAACSYYGYSVEEITRMNMLQINTLPREQQYEERQRAIQKQKGRFLFTHRLANGEIRDVDVYGGPIELNGQRLLYAIVHDITQQKTAEDENRRVNAALKERLIALSQPITDLGTLKFEDMFNLDDIQAIQDAFSNATGVASIITSTDGRPITRPSNFCQLCNNIIRQTSKGLANCMNSDAVIGSPCTDGPTIRPCLSSGLLDAGASIMVGDHHIANWLIGQVLDTNANVDAMLDYAKEIGADEDAYRAALANVSKMPADQFANISQALYLISAQLSRLAVQNIQQARVLQEREQAQVKLARVNRLYAVLSQISQTAVRVETALELYRDVCEILIQHGQFKMAWIGLLDSENQLFQPAAWAGDEQGYLQEVFFKTDHSPQGIGPAGTSIRECRLIYSNNMLEDPKIVWKDQASRRGYQSLASIPLLVGSQAIGSLVVYAAETDFFDEREISLLQEVSATISFALESIEAKERRNKAESALQESEEKYRRLFSSGNDAIFVFPILKNGHLGKFIEVNPVACERLGYTMEELLARSPKDVIKKVTPADMKLALKNILRTGSTLLEVEYITRAGNRIPTEVNSRMFEYQGQPHILSIARDITERKQAEKKIQNQLQRLSALRAIDNAINMKVPLALIIEIVLSQVIEQLNVTAADILLYQPEKQELQFRYGKGFQTAVIEGSAISIHATQANPNPTPQKQLLITDLTSLDASLRAHVMAAEGLTAYHAIPLVTKGEVLGVLEIFCRDVVEEEKEWYDYLETLAGQAAIAIEDARLVDTLLKSNQELSQAYDETIEGWSRALDLRDRETEGHSQRVTEMTLELARVLGLPDTEQVHVRRGSLLHDIGKVGVPDRILLKPDSLTAEEWQVMKRHPQYAANLLSPITFLRPALDIPYCHHEKWDGTGYPRGLQGEEIPLAARIFSVVDVWDALLSDRPYRRGWPEEEVIAFIEAGAGKHFDPKVVTAFIEHIHSGKFKVS